MPVIQTTPTEASRAPIPPSLCLPQGLEYTVDQKTHKYLVEIYFSDMHSIYPFLDESLPFLSSEWPVENNRTQLIPGQRFILELVYAIASQQVLGKLATNEQHYIYRNLADECHRRGLMLFDKAATDISIASMEAVTLAALHSTFSPQKGNFGQLIGLASRLAIDLETGDRPRSNQNEEGKMERVYMSIYCLENQFATAMDRPGLLPAPVINEYEKQQHILCAIYRIQSRFRSRRRNEEITSLLQELAGYISSVKQIPSSQRHNLLAVAYETRLLLQPNDAESAACLLEIYVQEYYVTTSLSPSWAYRAGLVIFREIIKRYPQQEANATYHPSNRGYQAYGNCLLFLEKCSRRWPSANSLRQSLQSFVSG